MPKHIASDIKVVVNSVDLSAHAFNVDVSLEKDKVDVSGFNASGAREYLPGQKDEEITVSFRQDFDSAKVDQTLWPLYNNGNTFPITVNPTSSAASASNPTYSGSANLYEYHPLNAELGDVSETQVTFALTGGITRGTA